MLNYFERLDSYKRRNLFQVNGSTVDVYGPMLSVWSQNLDIVKDVLTYAHSIDVADAFGILTIKLTGADITEQTRADFTQTLATANQVLSTTLGSSDMWESIKQEGTASRLFLAIILDNQKPNNDTKQQSSSRRPKSLRIVSPDSDPV